MTLQEHEQELKKRLAYPYKWGRKQGDYFNGMTNFVYQVFSFDNLIAEIDKRFKESPDYDAIFNYSLIRWYNFWSAKAVEEIFCSLESVTPAKNERDRLVDFTIGNINFDHKTTVFPKGFGYDLNYAENHPEELIKWLYENQSQEQRKHLKNRLFIVLFSNDGEHWRLKAEITWLKTIIEEYARNFDSSKLHRFSFEPNSITLSDIIWAIK